MATEFYQSVELRTKTPEQLQRILSERQEKYRHLRFKVSSREVKNHRELRYMRREIARIQTTLNQKRAGAQPAADAT